MWWHWMWMYTSDKLKWWSDDIEWRWKNMMLKNEMMKHGVMILNVNECDNIWCGKDCPKMNGWRTVWWHWMWMRICDNTCCNAQEYCYETEFECTEVCEIIDVDICVWIWVCNEQEMSMKTL